MLDIGLATCARLPELDPDSRLLIEALEALGIQARPVVWSDPTVDWSDMQACVIRSTWDYAPRLAEFLTWVDRTASLTRLWNPASMVRWNSDKAYLLTLEAEGFPIIPTRGIPDAAPLTLAAVMHQTGWTEVVIKPAISASGDNTLRVDKDNLAETETRWDDLLNDRDMLVQPYLKSIEAEGELSLIYMEGAFSHAVRKFPASGEFRVQEHFGGQTRREDPSDDARDLGDRLMAHAAADALYGRVDLVTDLEGRLCLSELELIEPSLFHLYDPSSAERFARCISRRLTQVTA